MDVSHPALGFTTSWANALARRCDHVSVITMRQGELAVADNVTVHSLGAERGYSDPRLVARFYRLVHRTLRERPVDACFSHMAATLSLLFAPMARLHGIPTLLWYAHGVVSRDLIRAHRVVDRCVTSTRYGFQWPSDKLYVIGQGIDVDAFRPPANPPAAYERTVLSIGRISAIKGSAEMVQALSVLRREMGIDLRLLLVGGELNATEESYARGVRELVEALDLSARIEFTGPIPYREIPAWYHRGATYLNLTQFSLDKAILEAMASGCVPVARNAALASILAGEDLDWLNPAPGASGLAESVARAVRLSPGERTELTGRLRRIVVQDHSLESLADRLVDHLRDLAAARPRRRRDLGARRTGVLP